MSNTTDNQNQPSNSNSSDTAMLDRLLPTFKSQLDDGWLDLMDRIPQSWYEGCGYVLLAINPDNNSIHSLLYEPVLLSDEEKHRVTDEFAERVSSEGYTPVWSMFSGWQAGWFSLYYTDEFCEQVYFS